MTDDLIARLRETKPRYDQNTGELLYHVFCNRDGEETADALEALRKHADAMAEVLHQCTAVLTAKDCASVSKVLTAYRTAFPETAP